MSLIVERREYVNQLENRYHDRSADAKWLILGKTVVSKPYLFSQFIEPLKNMEAHGQFYSFVDIAVYVSQITKVLFVIKVRSIDHSLS